MPGNGRQDWIKIFIDSVYCWSVFFLFFLSFIFVQAIIVLVWIIKEIILSFPWLVLVIDTIRLTAEDLLSYPRKRPFISLIFLIVYIVLYLFGFYKFTNFFFELFYWVNAIFVVSSLLLIIFEYHHDIFTLYYLYMTHFFKFIIGDAARLFKLHTLFYKERRANIRKLIEEHRNSLNESTNGIPHKIFILTSMFFLVLDEVFLIVTFFGIIYLIAPFSCIEALVHFYSSIFYYIFAS